MPLEHINNTCHAKSIRTYNGFAIEKKYIYWPDFSYHSNCLFNEKIFVFFLIY